MAKKATRLIEKAIDALINVRDDAFDYWKEPMQRAIDSLNSEYRKADERENNQ